jgi:hypothetical protein
MFIGPVPLARESRPYLNCQSELLNSNFIYLAFDKERLGKVPRRRFLVDKTKIQEDFHRCEEARHIEARMPRATKNRNGLFAYSMS